MTIKAYHYVPALAMEAVMDQGEIVPGIERLDPATFVWDCQNTMNELRDLVEGDGLDVDPVAWEALHDLIDVEIRKLERRRGEHTQKDTEFLCVDLLAGDLDRIFLSLGNWVSWAPDSTGFVFDVDDLVKKGAGIRLEDYSGAFIERLKWILSDRWRSRESVKRAIRKELAGFIKGNEYRGRKAGQLLRGTGASMAHQAELGEEAPAEVLWEGPLPLYWAIEVWDEGRKVAV